MKKRPLIPVGDFNPMKKSAVGSIAFVTLPYGPLKTGIPYSIKEEGRDYFRFNGGTMVPKNLVTFTAPKKREEPEFFVSDEWEN
jgi:hypothetical protein